MTHLATKYPNIGVGTAATGQDSAGAGGTPETTRQFRVERLLPLWWHALPCVGAGPEALR